MKREEPDGFLMEKADDNSEVRTQSVPMQDNPTFSRIDLEAALSVAKVSILFLITSNKGKLKNL